MMADSAKRPTFKTGKLKNISWSEMAEFFGCNFVFTVESSQKVFQDHDCQNVLIGVLHPQEPDASLAPN